MSYTHSISALCTFKCIEILTPSSICIFYNVNSDLLFLKSNWLFLVPFFVFLFVCFTLVLLLSNLLTLSCSMISLPFTCVWFFFAVSSLDGPQGSANILGFVDRKAKSRVLYRYFYNHLKMQQNKIKTFLASRPLKNRQVARFGSWVRA